MKRLVLCLLASAALGGCASTNGPSASTDMRSEDDTQQMAAIERAAARSGVQVIWLRPPQKKSPG